MCYASFSLHVSTAYEMNVFCGFMQKYIVYIGMFLHVYVECVYVYAAMWLHYVVTYVHTHINSCSHFTQLCIDQREMMNMELYRFK